MFRACGEGEIPRPRTRVTFGLGPKSHQKGRLETLFPRPSCAFRTSAVEEASATRSGKTARDPKCGIVSASWLRCRAALKCRRTGFYRCARVRQRTEKGNGSYLRGKRSVLRDRAVIGFNKESQTSRKGSLETMGFKRRLW